jgi:N-acylneuraminate cytidylyltransferase
VPAAVSRNDTIAVIPARGGSKRIPRKNIKPFCGVPLLARTVQMLRNTSLFARIIVSTDDDEIADVATAAGAEVPFKRPAALADDTIGDVPVIRHAIEWLSGHGQHADLFMCVYPAAVLVHPETLRRAVDQAAAGGVDFVFAVAAYPHPAQRALRKTSHGGCEMVNPEHRLTRSQDLEPLFFDAGQFKIASRNVWISGRPVFSQASRMIELDHAEIQDIDTLADWNRAERLFLAFHQRSAVAAR